VANPDRIIPTTNTQPKRQRGDGRTFLRGSRLWCGFSVDGVEHRESTKTNDPIKAEKYLRMRLKEVHAHQFSRTKFISQRDHRRTIADLMDALKTNFELREKDSPQNLSNIRRVKKDFSIVRATNLTAEAIADYVRDQLAAGLRP
jgi:hypothetical protein